VISTSSLQSWGSKLIWFQYTTAVKTPHNWFSFVQYLRQQDMGRKYWKTSAKLCCYSITLCHQLCRGYQYILWYGIILWRLRIQEKNYRKEPNKWEILAFCKHTIWNCKMSQLLKSCYMKYITHLYCHNRCFNIDWQGSKQVTKTRDDMVCNSLHVVLHMNNHCKCYHTILHWILTDNSH